MYTIDMSRLERDNQAIQGALKAIKRNSKYLYGVGGFSEATAVHQLVGGKFLAAAAFGIIGAVSFVSARGASKFVSRIESMRASNKSDTYKYQPEDAGLL